MGYPHEMFLNDDADHRIMLSGLARECPACKIVDHYDVEGRKPVEVICKCGHRFTVQKYKRGERPKAKHNPALNSDASQKAAGAG